MATHFDKFEDRNNFKFNLIEGAELTGKYGFPKLRRSEYVPKELVPFNFAKTFKTTEEACVHFFIDDFQFERIWNYPNKYINLLKKFEGVITPDFSMLSQMSVAQRIWNCYRNRALAFWMQANGIKIVPTIEWAYYSEFEWCIDGIPKNSSVAIGSYGCLKNSVSKYGLLKGIERIANELEPRVIVCYGPEIKSAYGLCNRIIFFENYCKSIKKRIK